MSVSAIMFLDQRGKPVLQRDYRCARPALTGTLPWRGVLLLLLHALWRAGQAGGGRGRCTSPEGRPPSQLPASDGHAPPAAAAANHPCRGDVPLAKVADRFMAKVNELEEAGGATPILVDGSLSFLYVQYSNLYVLAVTQANVNAAATLVFLHKLIDIFKHYFHEASRGRGTHASLA
jgi:hypothetical protein